MNIYNLESTNWNKKNLTDIFLGFLYHLKSKYLVSSDKNSH